MPCTPTTLSRLEDPDHVTEPTTSAAPRPDGLPARETAAPKTDLAPLDLARRIVELAEDKKAADIVLLDLGELTTLADAFVICSGGSERQIAAIADGIAEKLRDEGIKPIGREGTSESHWVLLDYGSVIVHVFTPAGARLLRPREALVRRRGSSSGSSSGRSPAGFRVRGLPRRVPRGAVLLGHVRAGLGRLAS